MKRYNRRLRELIQAGKARPSFIVSHKPPLDQAADAYRHFDARDEGWTKVILHPGLTAPRQPRARQAATPQTRRRPSRPTASVD